MATSRTFTTSPLMFESDDEDSKGFDGHKTKSSTEDGKATLVESSVRAPVVVDEPKKEEKLLKGFQTVLMGIPPPPAFTVPQLDVRELLMLWRDNHKYKVVLSPGKERKDEAVAFENKVKCTKWPEAMGIDNWDIYYNRSAACEEMERLSMRYKDRYVGAETSSSVNALFAKSPSRTASARKRARSRAWGHSPGRRLSHLARRRKAFSYCSVAGNNNPDKKMIMVEIKKISNRQKKRNSVKKTKPTPKKKAELQEKSHKRALFQSPDQLPAANETQTPNTQRIQRSKRNLFVETSSDKINENGKRERTVPRKVSPRKRVNRSLSFQDNMPLTAGRKEVPVAPSTAQALKTILTGAHKQKMLWAVTNALRDQGIRMSHDLFRPSLSVLFKACQKLWLTKEARLPQEGSTSENMLALVKQFTTYTVNQLCKDPTSEHMTMVCGNIIKIAASQSKSSGDSELGGNMTEDMKSTKSSPIRINETNEQPGSDVDKLCALKEDLDVCTNTNSIFNTSHSKENSSRKKYQNKDSPSKSNILSNQKCPDLKIVLTPLRMSKDLKIASKLLVTNVDSNSSPSPVCQKLNQLRRSSRSTSVEFSVTEENANKGCESTEAQTSIISSIEQCAVVCQEGHEETSKVEDSNVIIIHNKQTCTPNKVRKNNSLNKKSPNTLSRVTRRKSQELIMLNVTSVDDEIKLSEPAVETMNNPQIISHTENKTLIGSKDEAPTSYSSPRSFKKSGFNKRRNSSSPKQNMLCVNEAGSLTLSSKSHDNLETNHTFTCCLSQNSKSPLKVPEIALDTTTLTTNVCITNNELESCSFSQTNTQPLKSILCKPLVRTQRSIPRDSPVKSVTLNENDTIYYNVNSSCLDDQKTDEYTKPKLRIFFTSPIAELSPQKSNFTEGKSPETIKSPVFVDCNETEKSLSQECTEYNWQECERNKENIENSVVATSCNIERKLEVDNTCTNPMKRLPLLTPISQMVSGETLNRTLQLYSLSNSGVDPNKVFGEPPVLVPHWELQQQQTTRCTDSPPSLIPHWEQTNCSGSTSLPETIMSHWQQMSTNISTNSDKIMFDFEDTSYEIKFSPNNEDSTASSVCAPFAFPHLIDESKSGFNTFTCTNSSRESCDW